MTSFDRIIGKVVHIQSKSQINLHEWKPDPNKSYLIMQVLNADVFNIFTYLKTAAFAIIEKPLGESELSEHLREGVENLIGTDTDDFVQDRNRVFIWSKGGSGRIKVDFGKTKGRKLSRGHRKQICLLKDITFCCKDVLIEKVEDDDENIPGYA